MPNEENEAEFTDVDELSLREDESGVFHLPEDGLLDSDVEAIDGEGSSERKIVKLQGEAKKREQEAKKQEERYLYLLADFENYKKRVQREQLDQSKFANEKLLREVLVVLDDLERAISHFKESSDFEKVVEGLSLVSKQFLSFLNRFGVSPIECLNKPFDPTCHQAVAQVDRDDLPDGEVAEEIQKGYMLHDRLIRPSFVMISKNRGTSPAGATCPAGGTSPAEETFPTSAVPRPRGVEENSYASGVVTPLGETIDNNI